MRLKLAVLLSALSATFGLTSAVAAPAAPSAPAASPVFCSGTSCDGRDATEMGCVADAIPLTGFVVKDDHVTQQPKGDLNYSPACRAVWGEYNTVNADDIHHVVLFVQPEYGGVERSVAKVVTGAGHWETKMAAWNNSVKFCATHSGYDPDATDTGYGGLNVCTRWR
ncbi:Protein of unknown function [Amycolatopsis xylanica]|uniref:DUF2690 domain-containing protein n=1 Tax=Amycolatopsis xylanica TaxID=589385 RepID=A0A1H3HC82_9PSEU|nr:DUF2690 domain-containing protein [Amycolatopsis xylanica]SDY13106.1 Protein of unknown function [Amycolatopsis xylanica]